MSVLTPAWRAALAGCLGLVAAPAWSQASGAAGTDHPHAHVHGAARLGIAVQDETVSLQLESPLDSLIGFEHLPTTSAQQAAVDALRSRLRAPTDLFAFDAAANCTLAKSEAESAIFEAPPAGAASDAHADLDARFEYRCANPERLTRVDIGLLAACPKLQRLEIEVATAKGQFKRELRPPARSVSLTR